MQLLYNVFITMDSEEIVEQVWADEVQIRDDGILIFFEYTEESQIDAIYKAAFKYWDYFTVNEGECEEECSSDQGSEEKED
jgi:hypothetical protein